MQKSRDKEGGLLGRSKKGLKTEGEKGSRLRLFPGEEKQE